jgi:hypothetical protein
LFNLTFDIIVGLFNNSSTIIMEKIMIYYTVNNVNV